MGRRSLFAAAVRLLRQSPRAYSAAAPPSPRVSAIVDEISSLTLLEASSLSAALHSRLALDQLPVFALVSPGGGGGGASSAPREEEEKEKKEEKSSFDLRLESFEAANKIKVIKEVRGLSELGLKEAKELVEKAPTVIKKGVSKEEAQKIVDKMKDIGAKVVLD